MTDDRHQTSDSSRLQSAVCSLQSEKGITLFELLVASVLGVVVMLAMGQVDVSRIYHSQEVRGTATAQGEAGFAVTHITKQLMLADRVNLLSAGDLQLRAPIGTSFDLGSNYVWKEYKYDSPTQELRFYDPAAGCTLAATFRDLSAVTMTQAANNTLQLAVASTNPYTDITMTYNGQATLRASANDVTTGLADPSVSPPPAICP